MALFDKTFPTLDCSICILGPLMLEIKDNPNIELLTYSEIENNIKRNPQGNTAKRMRKYSDTASVAESKRKKGNAVRPMRKYSEIEQEIKRIRKGNTAKLEGKGGQIHKEK